MVPKKGAQKYTLCIQGCQKVKIQDEYTKNKPHLT